MKVLIKWLKEYTNISEAPDQIAEMLTMSGLEVESITDFKNHFKNIKTARILNIVPHPDADKLNICDVSLGDSVVKVVCGAPNVSVGQNVIMATPGAQLSVGKIEKTVIRGVESNGMICSEKELGLALHSDGIAVLPDDTQPGMDLWQLYPEIDDYILDISITPNRGDCLSHLGIAREIAALTNTRLTSPTSQLKLSETSDFANIIVENSELCPRYTACLIKNVTIKPSPAFIKFRLLACGMRPINNIVDITNYIMLDMGQPLHAFDYDLISEKTIIVRNAKQDELFTTLDGKERLLTKDDLVIADKSRTIALAGVMGGLNTEVTEKTKNILLESAFFNPASIRKTAKRLSLQSEASYRFERTIDIATVHTASEKAASMMKNYADGEPVEHILDCYPNPYKNKVITFRPVRCMAYLGCDELPQAEKRLSLLNFGIEKKRFEWDITVPSYRSDVTIEEDIYEEIARLGFYKEISTQMPTIKIQARQDNKAMEFKNILRNCLVDNGVTEVITYSFILEKEVALLNLLENLKSFLVYIKNPLTEESVVMRPNLVVNHLNVASQNHSRLNYNFAIFEIGKKYSYQSNDKKAGFVEKNVLSLAFSGLDKEKSWYSQEEKYTFFKVKGFIEQLFMRLLKHKISIKSIAHDVYPFLHPIESAEILSAHNTMGFLGLVHPDVYAKFDLKRDVYIAELDLDKLKQLYLHNTKNYLGVSKYPWVDRDITVIAEENLCNADILSVILKTAGDILKDVKLIDIFRGEKLGKNKKSLTYKLFYQSYERTLSDEEVNIENEKIAKALVSNLNIEFPK